MPDFNIEGKLFDEEGNLEDETVKKGKTKREDLEDQ
jgi:hypothetical protein